MSADSASSPAYPAEAWDTVALRSLAQGMGQVTRVIWPARRPGQQQWFLFGGCLFWLVVGWVILFWYLLKAELWAAVVGALLACWLGVLIAGGCWRGYRRLRHDPVGRALI